MNSFGKIKSKILHKLGESYISGNKTEMKSILKTIKENKDFKEMYLFYEEIENLELTDQNSAQLYVETVEPLLIDKAQSIRTICEELSKTIGEIEFEKNDLYECLDTLSQKSNLNNLDQKVLAKKKIIEYLKTKKQLKESEAKTYTSNENLLHAVLANNFNVLYNNTLDKESKDKLKNILSIKEDELNAKVKELSENIINKVNSLINESSENELTEKLEKVKKEINGMSPTKYNYYRLTQLENGLN